MDEVERFERRRASEKEVVDRQVRRIEDKTREEMEYLRDAAEGTIRSLRSFGSKAFSGMVPEEQKQDAEREKRHLERALGAQVAFARAQASSIDINKSEAHRKSATALSNHADELDRLITKFHKTTHPEVIEAIQRAIQQMEQEALRGLGVALTRTEQARRALESA